MEETAICPYTGLRPFTEDESLYFKGRDEHIMQATNQLAKNKFIMLTGASGDGKSSLVYAGIIPNAKAGFLRSQFSNWVVADFRPERNPLGNLSQALARQLGIASESTVRAELSHGFSALVDVYKASPFYLDTVEEDFTALDDQQKAKRKRTAANLILIADQFEEFFTNPENFHKGVPSQEAALVTNLLLETARIALEENLPIYVIITMRSDFIGQCAAFRGLPEAIGFSQFFVPRLNRAQLQEVIEEPAMLSGNRIARRLTERLIHDMVEGTDQLPILQHALNQIWKMADEGRAEMDLVHYAMVGGMRGDDLPPEDLKKFSHWFGALPPKIQACYDQPDLQNVLNTHADKLYTFAAERVKANYGISVADQDAEFVIETAFKCLTKIDNSRAVRNRMTLGEITAVINQPHLTCQKVGQILSVFREPGNTLLRPFSDEVPELSESSVLDITHESLIRNWGNLNQWAKDEFNSYTIYLDFSQQMNRWVESDKSGSFLLYIGPLTFFENWFEKAKPNVEWIARYLGEDLKHDQRKAKAAGILANAHEFLQRSARKHAVTRTVMKYGPRKIAAVLAVVALVGLSSFVLKTYLDRRNESVLSAIRDQSVELLNNQNLRFADRGLLATYNIQLGQLTIREAVEKVQAPLERIKVANGIATVLVTQGRTQPDQEIRQAIKITDSLLSNFPAPYQNAKELSEFLTVESNWRATLGLLHFYNPTEEWKQLQIKHSRRCAQHVLTILKNPPQPFSNILDFGITLETAINFNAFEPQELDFVINSLSPFVATEKSDWVKASFQRHNLLFRGYQGYAYRHNGLYQMLAYLYAAKGNAPFAVQAVDTLLKYNQSYFMNDYSTMLDNATNVASVFYRTNHANELSDFVRGYCAHKNITQVEFYQRLLGRAKPYQLSRNIGLFDFWEETQNLNLQYGDHDETEFFFEAAREAILATTSSDEAKFLLAVSYKDQGVFLAHRSDVTNRPYDTTEVEILFAKAIAHYQDVSKSYLNQIIERAGNGAEFSASPRKHLFIYPDVISSFLPLGARDFHWNYMSPVFIRYLIDQNLFADFFQERSEQLLLQEWLASYQYHAFAEEVFQRNQAPLEFFEQLDKAVVAVGADKNVDLNLLYLFAGYYAKAQGKETQAAEYYMRVKADNLANIFNYRLLTDYIRSGSFILVGHAYSCLQRNNYTGQAHNILEFFKKPANRSSLYAYAALLEEISGRANEQGKLLIDSAIAEMNRVENLNLLQPNRFTIGSVLLARTPSQKSVAEALRLIKNQPIKFGAMRNFSSFVSYRKQAYLATTIIPDNISDADRLFFLRSILQGSVEGMEVSEPWRQLNKNVGQPNRLDNLIYVEESN